MYRSDISITGTAALALIFVALMASGANTGALAGYFGAILMCLAVLKIAAMPSSEVANLLNTHWLSVFAALTFITLAGLSALPAAQSDLSTWLARANLASVSPYRTVEGIAALVAPLAAFALGAASNAERGQRAWNASALLVLAIAFAAWALIDHASGDAPRLSARLGSANTAACVFGMVSIFAAAHWIRGIRRLDTQGGSGALGFAQTLVRASPLALAALALSATCLVLTLSRGGIVAAAGGFAVLATFVLARGKAGPGRIWMVVLAAIALLGAGAFVLLQRTALAAASMGGGDAISFNSRQTLVDVYWREFLERPLFGHGLNTYHELAALNSRPENWEALRTSGSVHNIYVQALAESGVVGLTLLALALLPTAWRAARGASGGSEWAAAAVGMTALCLIQGVTDFGLQTPAIAALLCFVLGGFARTSQSRNA